MHSFWYSVDGNDFRVRVPEQPASLFEAAAVAVWDRFGEQNLTCDSIVHVVGGPDVEGGLLRVGDILHWLQTPEGQAFLDGKHDNVRFVLDKAASGLLKSHPQEGA